MTRQSFTALFLILVATGCNRAADSVRQNSEEAKALIEEYSGLELPPIEVLGLRGAWKEQFAKLRLEEDDIPKLRGNPGLVNITYIPDVIDGMDPTGITEWWNPRDVRRPVVYRRGPPEWPRTTILIIDTSDHKQVLAYIYTRRP